MRIMYVCLGNICRSPIARSVGQYICDERNLDWVIDSCGTAAYHSGENMDHRSADVLAKHGLDNSHSAKQLQKSDFETFDFIVCMDRSNINNAKRIRGRTRSQAQLVLLGDYDPEEPGSEVPDPYYGGKRGFDLVYEQITRCIKSFYDSITE
ncbi:hypothetical protein PCE1_003690 [Barthelona sp. PCE]